MSQTPSIQDWLAGLEGGAGPRYLQIADAIELALAEGRLRPGDRLPPQRSLAAALGVDLTTITRAYDEAKRRHLLEGQGARGTYAAAPKVNLAQMLDLGLNIPPPPSGVDFSAMLKHGLSQVLMRSDSGLLMTYHLGGGSEADRAAGAAWLAPMFRRVDPGHVVACPGAQAALAALILSLTEPGGVILAEGTVYPGLHSAAAALGRRVLAVATDEAGMLPDALEQGLRTHNARLVYLNPTLQNPTARTMPEQRRRELARIAVQHDVRIIEDDPYWLLAVRTPAPAPLARHAPSHVCYVSTLSKCLSPGLRTAYALLPEPWLRERFVAALRSFSLMSPPLTTSLATQWIHDGTAAQLLDGVRAEAQARQALAHQLLAGSAHAEEGIHVWLNLPSYWTSSELARAARAEGLAVTASEAFDVPGMADAAGAADPGAALDPRRARTGLRAPADQAIRISLGSIQDRARLASALRKLSALLARRPSAQRAVVI